MQAFGKKNVGLPTTGILENYNKLNANDMKNFVE